VRGRGRLAGLALACFVVGAGLMLAFEMPATRIAGVLLLTGWIVIGAFALATPEYLGREDDSED
jgi:hypothetical protein